MSRTFPTTGHRLSEQRGMHIKQIIIQGFKSYKEQTVMEPFSPRHNAVVGRNGSGKSNFFWAIRFVLGDAYGSMTREERQSLLHEGTGPATISAFVEIIFDNSDNRFPTGKEEVVLRRTIGLKKDEYSLDRKSVTKSEVMNLLESAGFSRSNPYYIVPQGRIMSLTNAKDHERLHLLKEVAGTKVYEQRRHESVKIMEETALKQTKIDELLEYIDERLQELEKEKEELQKYQTAERERRGLEYSIYSQEQLETTEALAELEEIRQAEVESYQRMFEEINERDQQVQTHEEAIQQKVASLRTLTNERQQYDDEYRESVRAKATLELTIKDLREAAQAKRTKLDELVAQRAQIEAQIAERGAELDAIVPEFDSALQSEADLRSTLEQLELELKALQSKAGRSAQFKSKQERDRWLRSTIKQLAAAAQQEAQQAAGLESDIERARARIAQINEQTAKSKERLARAKSELEDVDRSFRELRAEREKNELERKSKWKEEASLSSALEAAREDVQKSERIMFGTLNRATSAGLASVKRITKELGLKGVYGPLYELFTVDERFATAVEVIAATSLFHVVVDTDETATTLLEELARRRGGRVTFMPLNRLRVLEQRYPPRQQGIPIIDKLRFDETYLPAFKQVFGKAIVCETIELASSLSIEYSLTGVTMDGDRADRKGALSGGFRDHRQSRLKASQRMSAALAKLAESEARLETVKAEIRVLDQKITQTRDGIGKLDSRRREAMSMREPLNAAIQVMAREELETKDVVAQRERSLQALRASIHGLHAQIQSYEAEIATPMLSGLGDAEKARLAALREQVDQIKAELATVVGERTQLESRKNVLSIEVHQNLRRQLDSIVAKIEALGGSSVGQGGMGGSSGDMDVDLPEADTSAAADLDTKTAELARTQKLIEDAETRLSQIDVDAGTLQREIDEGTEVLEALRAEQASAQRQSEQQQRKMEKLMSRKALLLKKKEDALNNIRDLGVLPEEAFLAKFKKLSARQLLKQLRTVNDTLKLFGHVNKKAFEQFNNFAQQKEQLQERKVELDNSHRAIEDLIRVLDQRKDDAIERTFNQVARNFSGVWEAIVPNGQGRLMMQRRADGAGNGNGNGSLDDTAATQEYSLDPERQRQLRHSAIEQYTGVAISVSFNSKTDEGLSMPQLSGGQKSLVALALIFAIQRSDPAPFYLFDEIDAALDAQYRKAIANMVHQLSENAQFITTTFRSELLEHADKFYGVTFKDKVSRIQSITKEQAQGFVDDKAA
ncbi:Structural maintenance of chromosomes protein 3 [Polyrhizophydium stewartii]|uniref:Structural maintenance of chromosomes protein n=1 Tax=Polyrhizophydium stewartii TaxID=2732419 RepID=A0ABR4NK29_9FUNG